MKNTCKICNVKIPKNRIYCSNKCKFSDKDYNRGRVSKSKNPKNKMLVCKLCNKKSKDILNKSGTITKHLSEEHSIQNFQNFMDYYEMVDISPTPKLNCKMCNYSTVDVNNKSGAFTKHILQEHGITPTEYCKKFPSESKLWFHYFNVETKKSIQKKKGIQCKLCGNYYKTISNSHCKSVHGITQDDYKLRFGDTIVCDHTSDKLSDIATNTNATRNWTYRSKLEIDICNFLESNNIKFIPTYKSLGTELDIYTPDYRIAIEVNGLLWHSELFGNKHKSYHLNKTNICNDNDIKLIHIFEDEWNDNTELVKKKLLHIFNKSDVPSIYARNTKVVSVSSKDRIEFLEKHHIQGGDKSGICYGLSYSDDLIAIMSFSKPRISLGSTSKNDTYELVRFATNTDYRCVGAAGKLLKHFINVYNPNTIYSYADLRWTGKNNNLYTNLGFKLMSISKPSYWYMPNYKTRMHRYNFTKHRIVSKFGGDINLSEWQNMQKLGYDRIWDCGNLKYQLDLL